MSRKRKRNTLPSKSASISFDPKVIRNYGNQMFRHGVDVGAKRAMSYHPAAGGGVLRNDWTTTTKSATSVIREDYETVCARAELAYRTDAVAKRIVNVLVGFMAGQGNKPTPAVKMFNGEFAEGVNKQLSDDWERFNDQGIRNGTSKMTVYGAQALDAGTMVIYGTALSNVVKSQSGSILPWAIQCLKPTRLDFSKDTSYWNQAEEAKSAILHGMKLNEYGEAVGYFFKDEETMRSAENVDLAFIPTEAEQYLGLSWLTPVLPAIFDRQQLVSDKLAISRIAAKFGVQLPRNMAEGIGSLKSTDDDGNEYLDLDFQGIFFADGKAQTIAITDPISNSFEPLMRMVLQEIAIGMNFSYQRFTSDLKDANFTSGRINTISDSKYFRQLYKAFCKVRCQQVYDRFVEWEAITGRLARHGVNYSTYLADPWYYQQCYWLPKDSEEWVDPLKDAQAMLLMYKMGLLEYDELCSMKGKSYKAALATREKIKKEMIEKGLENLLPENISTSPGDPSNSGQTEEVNNAATN